MGTGRAHGKATQADPAISNVRTRCFQELVESRVPFEPHMLGRQAGAPHPWGSLGAPRLRSLLAHGHGPRGEQGLGLREAGPLRSWAPPAGSWNALPRPPRVHSFNQSGEENLAKPRLHLKIRQNLLSTTSRRCNLVRTVLIIIFSLNSYCRIY